LVIELGLLTLKTLPLGGGLRLPAGKLAGILTDFRGKVKRKKFATEVTEDRVV